MSTYLYCGFSLNSQNVASNTSNVTFWVDVQMTGNSYNNYGMRCWGTITGPSGYRYTPNFTTRGVGKNSYVRVLTHTFTVTHNADGTGSVYGEMGLATNISAGTIYASSSITLPTIARASQPSIITYPNTTTNIGNMGRAVTVHMNRKSTAFTHNVRYDFGNAHGTIANGVTDNCSWTIPLSLANQIPNATLGQGQVVVDTYNGGTRIGTKNVIFNTSVPSSVIPTLSECAIELDNSENEVVKGWGIYVAGYSKVKITGKATGVYSSTIKSFKISGGVSTTYSGSSLNYTSPALTSGEKTFNVVAVDSRGRSSKSQVAGTATVYEYSPPSVMEFVVTRDQNDSTKVVVRANWTYSTVNGNNTTTATLFYQKGESTGWDTYGEIPKGEDTTLDAVFDEASSYNFRIVVRDLLSNTSQKEIHISTRQVLLDFGAGGKALGIGKIAELTEGVECSLPFYFLDAVMIGDVPIDEYIKSVVAQTVEQQLAAIQSTNQQRLESVIENAESDSGDAAEQHGEST